MLNLLYKNKKFVKLWKNVMGNKTKNKKIMQLFKPNKILLRNYLFFIQRTEISKGQFKKHITQ